MYLLHVLYFCVGLILGSFINVIIYRLPLDLSIIKPRSFCPLCKKLIPLFRNIPLISYCLQYGRCNNCKKKIPYIYPIVELTIGLIWLFSSIYFSNLNQIIGFSFIASILIAICVIDYKHYIIPFELSILSLIFTTITLCLSHTFISHLSGLILGTGYLTIIFLFTWVITKRKALGFGDIQLVLVLGFWLGDIRILLVIFFAAIVALGSWITLSIIYGFNKDRMLPFGSYLSIVSIIIYPIKFSFLNFL